MQRRNFLRVAGGGVILAAGAASSGCSRAMPAEAVAAWQGPGAETDLRRWVLGYAILAPHSHNLQSWQVDLSVPDEIVLRCDLKRTLPQTDPLSRQIMMSHGTFLELLDLAARERGHAAEVDLFPEGVFDPRTLDARPVARIGLRPDATVAKDPLFAQILRRRTNRSAYDPGRPVPPEAWAAMLAATRPHELEFGQVDRRQPEAMQAHRSIAAEAWRIELTTPAAILESYAVLRIGPKEVAQHRDGLTLMEPAVVWMNRLGLFDRTKPPAPGDYATTSQIEQFNAKLDATPAYLWLTSAGNDRATQVNSGRAYARVQLAAAAHGVVMQPLSQALQEYPEQAATYAAIHRLLGADPPARTVQMWARAGFAPEVEPAPRRGLDAHITRT